jgi:hypothetical protein
MSVVYLGLWAAGLLIGSTLLAMLLFGIRRLAQRRLSVLPVVVGTAPLVLIAVLGAALGDWARGAVLTNLMMLAAVCVLLLVSGLRGLFRG